MFGNRFEAEVFHQNAVSVEEVRSSEQDLWHDGDQAI
jgi:hypothetical protein